VIIVTDWNRYYVENGGNIQEVDENYISKRFGEKNKMWVEIERGYTYDDLSERLAKQGKHADFVTRTLVSTGSGSSVMSMWFAYGVEDIPLRFQKKRIIYTIKCPYCKSKNVEPSWAHEGYMQCNNCGEEWLHPIGNTVTSGRKTITTTHGRYPVSGLASDATIGLMMMPYEKLVSVNDSKTGKN
jgi:ribosomal protein L37AE/L43A